MKIASGGDDDVAQSLPVEGTAEIGASIRPRSPAEDNIAEARTLYGGEAATAAAYCRLDAWFEGEEGEFRRFAEMFRRLRN